MATVLRPDKAIIRSAWQNPKFHKLSIDERREVMMALDPKFRELPYEEQTKAFELAFKEFGALPPAHIASQELDRLAEGAVLERSATEAYTGRGAQAFPGVTPDVSQPVYDRLRGGIQPQLPPPMAIPRVDTPAPTAAAELDRLAGPQQPVPGAPAPGTPMQNAYGRYASVNQKQKPFYEQPGTLDIPTLPGQEAGGEPPRPPLRASPLGGPEQIPGTEQLGMLPPAGRDTIVEPEPQTYLDSREHQKARRSLPFGIGEGIESLIGNAIGNYDSYKGIERRYTEAHPLDGSEGPLASKIAGMFGTRDPAYDQALVTGGKPEPSPQREKLEQIQTERDYATLLTMLYQPDPTQDGRSAIKHPDVLKDPRWWTRAIGSGLGSSAVFMLTGGALPAAAMEAAQTYGSIFNELRDKGMDSEEAATRAASAGLATFATTSIANKLGLFNENLKGPLKRGAAGVASEGIEEPLTEVWSNLATNKPWLEGTPEALVGGVTAGGGFGLARGEFAKTPEDRYREAEEKWKKEQEPKPYQTTLGEATGLHPQVEEALAAHGYPLHEPPPSGPDTRFGEQGVRPSQPTPPAPGELETFDRYEMDRRKEAALPDYGHLMEPGGETPVTPPELPQTPVTAAELPQTPVTAAGLPPAAETPVTEPEGPPMAQDLSQPVAHPVSQPQENGEDEPFESRRARAWEVLRAIPEGGTHTDFRGVTWTKRGDWLSPNTEDHAPVRTVGEKYIGQDGVDALLGRDEKAFDEEFESVAHAMRTHVMNTRDRERTEAEHEEGKAIMDAALTLAIRLGRPGSKGYERWNQEFRPYLDEIHERGAKSWAPKNITPDTPIWELTPPEYRQHRPEKALKIDEGTWLSRNKEADWTAEMLGGMSNDQLEQVAKHTGVPTSGNKAEKVRRILAERDIRAKYEGKSADEILAMHTGKELKEILRGLKASLFGNKKNLAEGLLRHIKKQRMFGEQHLAGINWRRDMRDAIRRGEVPPEVLKKLGLEVPAKEDTREFIPRPRYDHYENDERGPWMEKWGLDKLANPRQYNSDELRQRILDIEAHQDKLDELKKQEGADEKGLQFARSHNYDEIRDIRTVLAEREPIPDDLWQKVVHKITGETAGYYFNERRVTRPQYMPIGNNYSFIPERLRHAVSKRLADEGYIEPHESAFTNEPPGGTIIKTRPEIVEAVVDRYRAAIGRLLEKRARLYEEFKEKYPRGSEEPADKKERKAKEEAIKELRDVRDHLNASAALIKHYTGEEIEIPRVNAAEAVEEPPVAEPVGHPAGAELDPETGKAKEAAPAKVTPPKLPAKFTFFTGSAHYPSIAEAATRRNDLGIVVTPMRPDYTAKSKNFPWIMVDNGAFGKEGFREDLFLKLLDNLEADPEAKKKVYFVVAPDVPFDADGTLKLFDRWADELHRRGFPVAIAGQNGMENMIDQLPWDKIDVLFIGGDDEWKTGFTKGAVSSPEGFRKYQQWTNLLFAAMERNIPVHMGRVNTEGRTELAAWAYDMQSADGTGIKVQPTQKLAELEEWLDRWNHESGDYSGKYDDTLTSAVEEDTRLLNLNLGYNEELVRELLAEIDGRYQDYASGALPQALKKLDKEIDIARRWLANLDEEKKKAEAKAPKPEPEPEPEATAGETIAELKAKIAEKERQKAALPSSDHVKAIRLQYQIDVLKHRLAQAEKEAEPKQKEFTADDAREAALWMTKVARNKGTAEEQESAGARILEKMEGSDASPELKKKIIEKYKVALTRLSEAQAAPPVEEPAVPAAEPLKPKGPAVFKDGAVVRRKLSGSSEWQRGRVGSNNRGQYVEEIDDEGRGIGRVLPLDATWQPEPKPKAEAKPKPEAKPPEPEVSVPAGAPPTVERTPEQIKADILKAKGEAKAQELREKMRAKMQGRGGAPQASFGDEFSKMTAAEIEEGIDDIADMGAQLLDELGGMDAFPEWEDEMRRTFGGNVEPFLDRLGDMVAEKIAEAEAEGQKQYVAEKKAREATDAGRQGEPERIREGSTGVLGGVSPEDVEGAGPEADTDREESGAGPSGHDAPDGGGQRPAEESGVRAGGPDVRVPAPGAEPTEEAGAGPSEPTPQEEGTDVSVEPGFDPEAEVESSPPAGTTESHTDYIITPKDNIGGGSDKDKAEGNVAAIRLMKDLQAAGRLPTEAEKEVLVRYVGWGATALSQGVFGNFHKSEWQQRVRTDLEKLLTPAEYQSAKDSVINAHYTSETVIRGFWEGMRRLGYTPGMRSAEPSAGVGHFRGLQPLDLRGGTPMTMVELDTISGGILKLLYPRSNVHVKAYENTPQPDNFFDVFVGNVPFMKDAHVPDTRYPNFMRRALHNYFFAKALDKTRPGGLIAMITSRYTMDSSDAKVRQYILERATLVGAIRLPSTAFDKNAGTKVTTDLIILKKRAEPAIQTPTGWRGDEWSELDHQFFGLDDHTSPHGTFEINGYYAAHPEMMLGEMAEVHMRREGEPGLIGDVTPENLAAAFERLPANVLEPYKTDNPEAIRPPSIDDIPGANEAKVGGYLVKPDGKIGRRIALPDGTDVVQDAGFSAIETERAKGMLAIRDAARDVFRTQLDPNRTEEKMAEARRVLGERYDAYVGVYEEVKGKQVFKGPKHLLPSKPKKGPAFDKNYLLTPGNYRVLGDDPDYPLLRSLEKYDSKTRRATKGDIFTERTIHIGVPITTADSAHDALAVAQAEFGRVNWHRMEQLTGRPKEELIEELGGAIYHDPEGDWTTADEYLSGDVRAKLKTARAAAEADPAYTRNVEALEVSLPTELGTDKVRIHMGDGWIPPSDYARFILEVLGTPSTVTHSPQQAMWDIDVTKRHRDSPKNTWTGWGTQEKRGHELALMAMNLRSPTIWRALADGSRVVDQGRTAINRAAQERLIERFGEWIWEDEAREKRLIAKYNDLRNGVALRKFDGSHLTFPGMNRLFLGVDKKGQLNDLRPHQKNAAWRIIQTGNTLLAHAVGAGKTFAMIAAGMELKRLGLARKPMYVVPKHLLNQWYKDFIGLYPAANILMLRPENLTPQKRQQTMANIATGNYDGVLVSYESFERLPLSPETKTRQIEEEVARMTEAILELNHGDDIDQALEEDAKEFNKLPLTVKQLVRKRRQLFNEMTAIMNDPRRDDGVKFEELGVDQLFVDEAHTYKNLHYVTKLHRVAGLPNTTAKRSRDMLIKSKYIMSITGGQRGLVFATGTPVMNSMAELYTMQRYLQQKELDERGVGHFDAWIQAFGEAEEKAELSSDGTGSFKMVNRMRRYVNLGDLLRMFRNVADVLMDKDLKLPRPDVRNGRPTGVHAKASPELTERFMPEIKQRTQDIRDGHVDPTEDSMLVVTSDARKASLDIRLIYPDAPDHPYSKVNVAVDNIHRIWQRTTTSREAPRWSPSTQTARWRPMTADERRTELAEASRRERAMSKLPDQWPEEHEAKLTQLVFLDMGTPQVTSNSDPTHPLPGKFRADDYVRYEGEQMEVVSTAWGQMPPSKAKLRLTKAERLAINPKPKKAQWWLQLRPANDPNGDERWLGEHEDFEKVLKHVDLEGNEIELDEETAEDVLMPEAVETAKDAIQRRAVYEDMRNKLVAKGVPLNQIAFIHDYNTPETKAELFDAVKTGEIRILLGSTAKMGTGMNVQKRMIALHHIDAPWRPGDLVQREGRIVRQGNINDEVEIFRYTTQGSYDARLWQMLATKADVIEQAMSDDLTVREVDELGPIVMEYQDIMGGATGNPLIMKKVTLEAEILKLNAEYEGFLRRQAGQRKELRDIPPEIKNQRALIEQKRGDIKVRDSHEPLFKINTGTFDTKTQRKEAGLALVAALAEHTKAPAAVPIHFGSYRGFKLLAVPKLSEAKVEAGKIVTKWARPQLQVKYPSGGVQTFDVESDSGAGGISHTELIVNKTLEDWIDKARVAIETKEEEKKRLEGALGKPWDKADRLKAAGRELKDVSQKLGVEANARPATQPDLQIVDDSDDDDDTTAAPKKKTGGAGLMGYGYMRQAAPEEDAYEEEPYEGEPYEEESDDDGDEDEAGTQQSGTYGARKDLPWKDSRHALDLSEDDADLDIDPVSRREILADLKTRINKATDSKVPVRKGKLPSTANGIYSPFYHFIRLRGNDRMQILTHEFAHHINNVLWSNAGGRARDAMIEASPEMRAHAPELLRIASPTASNKQDPLTEGFAEFLRYWVTKPGVARKYAPGFTDYFESEFKRDHPEVYEALEYVREKVQRWIRQGALKRLGMTIDIGPYEAWLRRAGNAVKTLSDKEKRERWLEETRDQISENFEATTSAFGRLMIDANRPIAEAQAEMETLHGKPLGDKHDAVMQAASIPQTEARALHFVRYGTFGRNYSVNGESLETILRSVPHLMNPTEATAGRGVLRLYLVAKRAIEKGRQTNPETGRNIETGIDPGDARKVRDLEKQFPELPAVAKRIYEWNDRLLDLASDFFTPEQMDRIRKMNQNYVPFQRVIETADYVQAGRGAEAQQKLVNVGRPVKRMFGSEADIIDPFESMIRNAYTIISAMERNKTAQMFFGSVDQIEGLGNIAYPVKFDTKVIPIGLKEILQKMKANNIPLPLGLTEKDLELVFRFYRSSGVPNAAKGEVTVWHNGERTVREVQRPELFRALSRLDQDEMHVLMKVLGMPAQLLRKAATSWSLDFPIANFWRDMWTAFLQSDSGFKPIDVARGAARLWKKDELYQEWLRSGGAMSGHMGLDREALQSMIKDMQQSPRGKALSMLNPLQAIQALSEISDEMIRLGEFSAARDPQWWNKSTLGEKRRAVSLQRAGLRSADATLRFTRQGEWARQINKLIPFFSASINGTARFAELHSPRKKNRKRMMRTMLRAFTSITVPTVMLWLMNKDDEDYQQLPQWQRDYFWNIPVPKGVMPEWWEKWMGPFITIPRPFLWGQIYGAFPERMLEKHWQENPLAFDDYWANLATGALPGAMPPLFAVVSEIWANKSLFTGKPIEQSYHGQPPEAQYRSNPHTTDFAKAAAQMLAKSETTKSLELSPAKIDQAIGTLTAAFGRDIAKLLGVFTGDRIGKGNILPPAVPQAADVPIVRRFVTRLSTQSTAGYFLHERLTELNQKEKSHKDGYKGAEGLTAEEVKEQEILTEAREEMSDLYNELNELKDKPSADRAANREKEDDYVRKIKHTAFVAMKEVFRERKVAHPAGTH